MNRTEQNRIDARTVAGLGYLRGRSSLSKRSVYEALKPVPVDWMYSVFLSTLYKVMEIIFVAFIASQSTAVHLCYSYCKSNHGRSSLLLYCKSNPGRSSLLRLLQVNPWPFIFVTLITSQLTAVHLCYSITSQITAVHLCYSYCKSNHGRSSLLLLLQVNSWPFIFVTLLQVKHGRSSLLLLLQIYKGFQNSDMHLFNQRFFSARHQCFAINHHLCFDLMSPLIELENLYTGKLYAL